MKKLFSLTFLSQKDVDLFIGKLLRIGVIISCIITFIGGVLYLYQQQGVMPNYQPIPTGDPFGTEEYLRSFTTLIPRILELNGAAIIQLGVICLVATPILRVGVSAIAFLIEKDYLYVVITLIVLAIIVANMFLGFH